VSTGRTEAGANGTRPVSRADLRADLAEFELRLRDHIESALKAYALGRDVDALTGRVAELEERVDVNRLWRNRLLGALAMLSFAVQATISWHMWG
jgi:hypothetical protein